MKLPSAHIKRTITLDTAQFFDSGANEDVEPTSQNAAMDTTRPLGVRFSQADLAHVGNRAVVTVPLDCVKIVGVQLQAGSFVGPHRRYRGVQRRVTGASRVDVVISN